MANTEGWTESKLNYKSVKLVSELTVFVCLAMAHGTAIAQK